MNEGALRKLASQAAEPCHLVFFCSLALFPLVALVLIRILLKKHENEEREKHRYDEHTGISPFLASRWLWTLLALA